MATRKTTEPAGAPSFRSSSLEFLGENIRPRFLRATGSVATDRADRHDEAGVAPTPRARLS